MEKYAGAEAFIEVMNSRGVEYIFLNPGIDTVPVQVTVSKYQSEGKPTPGIVLCLDESVAMAAAHGHYMVSGKPQVVLVHRELGTQQVGGAMLNAYMGRVPVILCAGISPAGSRKTWQQKAYDQGSIVRNCVKWEREVAPNENLAEAAQKAFQIASTEPCGPVYLAPSLETFKNETLPATAPLKQPVREPDAELSNRAADILISAQNPLILAGHSGRHHESVALLIDLAESLGARVLNGPVRLNFPTSHPLCAGIDPIGGGSRTDGRYIGEADTVLVIDYDLPYAAGGFCPGPGAKIICIDIDPVKKTSPLWGRTPDVYLEADSTSTLQKLNSLIQGKLSSAQRQQVRERSERIGREHQKIRNERRALAQGRSARKPISPDWLCHCLSQVIDQDTIIINQTITHSSFVGEQIFRSLPGTLLACAGGSIGWPLGAGLGAKLAAPGKTIVSLMGDGAFVWGCPTATLWASANYSAPFLSVIFNNQAYAAIKGLVQRAYGAEVLPAVTGFRSGVDISPPPNYAGIAQACGAYGRTVEEPSDILPALKEALAQVRAGKSAVLDVKLALMER